MPNPTTQTSQQGSPEIVDALRAARVAAFQICDEYDPFEWSDRLELAAEFNRMSEDVPEVLGLARGVQFRLESEAFDFTEWEERLETAGLVHSIIADLQTMQPGGAR
jgi:hypothetical protein